MKRTCPHCKSSANIGLDGLPESYRCGSDVMQDGSVFQSDPCRELCELRKWREVALKAIGKGGLLSGYYSQTGSLHGPVYIWMTAESFDEAVKKEVGSG